MYQVFCYFALLYTPFLCVPSVGIQNDRRRSRRSPSVSRSSSPPRRPEKSKEEREEAAKRAAIDELTRDQRTVFVNQLTMKVSE